MVRGPDIADTELGVDAIVTGGEDYHYKTTIKILYKWYLPSMVAGVY